MLREVANCACAICISCHRPSRDCARDSLGLQSLATDSAAFGGQNLLFRKARFVASAKDSKGPSCTLERQSSERRPRPL